MNEYLRPMKENFGSGPRTGNDARDGKRADFRQAKAERGDLAKSINRAYQARYEATHDDPRLEEVEGDVKPRKFQR